ncbi:hypothetical protein KAJ89_01075 [Candidatus Parcubacteria bacterium]|nr:hypothetical protein [Candidatus Parcubacteria bacterium]
MNGLLKFPTDFLVLTQGEVANECEDYYRECVKWLKVYDGEIISKIWPISHALRFAINAYNKFDFYFKGLKPGFRRSEYDRKRHKMSKKMLQTILIK